MRGAWFEMRDEASLLPFASVCHPVSRSPVLCENADTQGASGPHRQTNMHSAATVRFVLQRCWLTEPSLAGRAWQLQTFPQDFTATSCESSVTPARYSVRQSRFFTGFHSLPEMGEPVSRRSDHLVSFDRLAFGWDNPGWGGPASWNVLTNILDEPPAFSCKALNSKKLTCAFKYFRPVPGLYYGLPSTLADTSKWFY